MKIDYLILYRLIVPDVSLEYFVIIPLEGVVEEDIDYHYYHQIFQIKLEILFDYLFHLKVIMKNQILLFVVF